MLTSEVRQISILDSKQRALNLHISLLHAHWPIVFFIQTLLEIFFQIVIYFSNFVIEKSKFLKIQNFFETHRLLEKF